MSAAATAKQVRLRTATAGDVETLFPMINAAYAYTEGHVFGGAPRAERHDIRKLLEDIVVAELAGRILGCVHIDLSGDPAHFGLLAVDVSMHRTGLGSMLIEHAEARGREAGAATMRIETVKQAGIIPFYERHGYRIIGETDGQIWNGGADWGAIIPWQMVDMEKPLR